MLPSSHGVHIEPKDGVAPLPVVLGDAASHLSRSGEWPARPEIQPNGPPPSDGRSPAALAAAFNDFIAASARLELSYRELQAEVQQLGRELEERNLELRASLAENRGMRESLERILDSLPCGVLVVDAAGDIAMANPEAARLLGIEPDELRSLALVHATRGIDLGLVGAAVEPGGEQELRLSASDGSRRWLAVRRRDLGEAAASSSPSHAQPSPPNGIAGRGAAACRSVLVLRDVSARRREEEERDRARSAVALAEVSAVLAHEIRNPLASLELFAELIADCPERSGDWIGPMRAGIRGLGSTVNNVLTLYGSGAPALERVELARELATALEFMGPQAAQAEVRLRLEITPGAKLLTIRANRSALQQVVLNLVTNALKHTTAGGEVVVSARRTGQTALVSVRDTGCGIAVETLPKLFHERFSGSGTTPGLGLAVCGRLARQMGAVISVASQVGVGSDFMLEFPTGSETGR